MIADAINGILRVDLKTKNVEVLVDKTQINFPNDIIISKKDASMIYFTDSTELKFDQFDHMEILWKDYLLAKPSGKYVTIFLL